MHPPTESSGSKTEAQVSIIVGGESPTVAASGPRFPNRAEAPPPDSKKAGGASGGQVHHRTGA